MTQISFWMDSLPPSPNHGAGHWAKRHKRDDVWKNSANLLARDALSKIIFGRGAWPLEKATVRLTFIFKNRRRRDLDNLIAGSKGLIDGLVGVLITDDDWTHMALEVHGRQGEMEGVKVLVKPWLIP